MRVKVDEDLPKRIVELLREHGYSAISVREQGLHGTKDSVLWQIVQQEDYFFITADKGFGDIRLYPPGTHRGILLLRPDVEGITAYAELLRSVLSAVRLEDLAGLLAIATPRGLRVRRLTP
jgi:predicted nuclease of predicted toxin-antitoxin system